MLSVIRTTGKTQAEEKVSFKEVIFWKISGSYFYLASVQSLIFESCTCTLLNGQDVANQRQSRVGDAKQDSVN